MAIRDKRKYGADLNFMQTARKGISVDPTAVPPRVAQAQERRRTVGVLTDYEGSFVVDPEAQLLQVKDRQSTPEIRIKLGKLGSQTTDYGIEIYDSSGTQIFSASGLGVNTVGNEQMKDNAIDTAELVDLAIVSAKVAASAITTAKIADQAIETGKLALLAVTDDVLATDAVTASKIVTGAIIAGKIAANAVTATTIAAGAVTKAEVGYTVVAVTVTLLVPSSEPPFTAATW